MCYGYMCACLSDEVSSNILQLKDFMAVLNAMLCDHGWYVLGHARKWLLNACMLPEMVDGGGSD